MRFLRYLPAQFKEKVRVIRQDAFDRDNLIEVATDVVCFIVPDESESSVIGGRGVPSSEFRYTVHLEKPLDTLEPLDILERTDDSELQVVHIEKRSADIMKLQARDKTQVIP